MLKSYFRGPDADGRSCRYVIDCEARKKMGKSIIFVSEIMNKNRKMEIAKQLEHFDNGLIRITGISFEQEEEKEWMVLKYIYLGG